MICTICERGCYIAEASSGACGMYRNTGNVVEELYPDHYLLVCPISIETMPMLHYHPAAKLVIVHREALTNDGGASPLRYALSASTRW